MSNILSTDFYAEVRKGKVTGHEIIHKFGHNPSLNSATVWEGVHLQSTTYNFLTAATTVRVKAGGDAADDAAGLGAQSITIEGLGSSLTAISEDLATAGASASSATSASFWRVNRIFVSDLKAGTYGGANTASIVLENSAGGTDLISIFTGYGQSQHALYSVPTGKTAYFLSSHVTIDTNKSADFRVMTREALNDFSTPFAPTRIRLYWIGLTEIFNFDPSSPGFKVTGPADVYFEARGASTPEVSVDFELLIVDN